MGQASLAGRQSGRQNSDAHLVALACVLQLWSVALTGGAAPVVRLQPAASCITHGQQVIASDIGRCFSCLSEQLVSRWHW